MGTNNIFSQKIGEVWREVFVNAINPSNPKEHGDHLAFVTAPSSTMATATYLPVIDLRTLHSFSASFDVKSTFSALTAFGRSIRQNLCRSLSRRRGNSSENFFSSCC